MSLDATPPAAPDIDALISPASAYISREVTAAAYEEAHEQRIRNFGVTEALLAGMSLTTSMIDMKYWLAKAGAWYGRRAFTEEYNRLYPFDPLTIDEAHQAARAILELSDVHVELGL